MRPFFSILFQHTQIGIAFNSLRLSILIHLHSGHVAPHNTEIWEPFCGGIVTENFVLFSLRH